MVDLVAQKRQHREQGRGAAHLKNCENPLRGDERHGTDDNDDAADAYDAGTDEARVQQPPQNAPAVTQAGHALALEDRLEHGDLGVDARCGDREVVAVGDDSGLETQVDQRHIEVATGAQEEEVLVRPQHSPQDRPPKHVLHEDAGGDRAGTQNLTQWPSHEQHLAEGPQQRRQVPPGGLNDECDGVEEPPHRPQTAPA